MPRPASFRLTLRRAAGMAALGALLAPTLVASAPAQAAPPKAPVITSVAPLELAVGQTLTLRGRNFVKGRGKNTVVFKRAGGRAVFVKADLATAKMLQVTVPAKLEGALQERDDEKVGTRFELRVLGRKLSKATPSRLSPTVAPAPPEPEDDDAGTAPGATPSPLTPPFPGSPASLLAPATGDAATSAGGSEGSAPAAEEEPKPAEPCKPDSDLLDEATEKRLKLDPCNGDTDGDGVDDGYEYQSARDLNDDEYETAPNTIRPAPEKKPYPNPLFADSNEDYDGDTLTLGEEFKLWKFMIATDGAPNDLAALTYSDGFQYSVGTYTNGDRFKSLEADGYVRQEEFVDWANGENELSVRLVTDVSGDPSDPAEPRTTYDVRDADRDGLEASELVYYDLDGDGFLSDEERDEDADGLTNFAEARQCMTRQYWDNRYTREGKFRNQFGSVELDDPDSDGDGVRDGVDDQDHDDVPNLMECSRVAAGAGAPNVQSDANPTPGRPAKAFVNPYNPCVPMPLSRTCPRALPVSGTLWAPFTDDGTDYFVWN